MVAGFRAACLAIAAWIDAASRAEIEIESVTTPEKSAGTPGPDSLEVPAADAGEVSSTGTSSSIAELDVEVDSVDVPHVALAAAKMTAMTNLMSTPPNLEARRR